MASVKFNVQVNDEQLVRKTAEMAAATGRTIEEQTRVTMKGLVKYVMTYTPPASQRAQGRAAQGAGEVAVVRDMKKLFVPVELKGKRPEKYLNPQLLHTEAFSGGQLHVPHQKYHVDRAKITSLKTTLHRRVGLLASGWARAANELGVAVPAWIQRHAGSGRGTELQVSRTGTQFGLKVTNHMPSTAQTIAEQTRRLVESAKRAQIGSMTRQLPYILRRNLRGGH